MHLSAKLDLAKGFSQYLSNAFMLIFLLLPIPFFLPNVCLTCYLSPTITVTEPIELATFHQVLKKMLYNSLVACHLVASGHLLNVRGATGTLFRVGLFIGLWEVVVGDGCQMLLRVSLLQDCLGRRISCQVLFDQDRVLPRSHPRNEREKKNL